MPATETADSGRDIRHFVRVKRAKLKEFSTTSK